MTSTDQTDPVAGVTPEVNVHARAALAFGIVGAVGLSIICAVAALCQVKSRDEGRGLAVAGLAISAVWIVVFFALARVHLV
ncbi:hypothetical protein [Mycobacterium riyadhense]|uniref:DUF4190 domain-containing protein n=1 Tax=Mycobacterium riyadhense TaxID=486698 RepID=A0A1X2C5V6_9MYCO|nr:hypothetical protein [Mycobacterium riyadhense]MCV7146274.1 hypothetical protein [Mycobacterium riyadhense]ORW71250.1 hypothetical protein AWC22_24825 [Mycobacterium riyadhense]